MKRVLSVILCFAAFGLNAQSPHGDIGVSGTYCVTRISKDSLSLDIRITLVNKSGINYYYPKSVEQQAGTQLLSRSFRFTGYKHPVRDLSFDVGTVGYNSYDSLYTIKPSDTLTLVYSDLLMSSKNQRIIVDNYIVPTPNAVKSNAGGAKYLDRYTAGTKIIEYRLSYIKQKVTVKVEVRDYLNYPK